jgi:hypothetical protein
MFGQWRYTPDPIVLFFFWMTGKIVILLPDGMPAQHLEVLSADHSKKCRKESQKIATKYFYYTS